MSIEVAKIINEDYFEYETTPERICQLIGGKQEA